MALEGVIAERTRAILPVTWDALSRDPRYGDDLLQTAINTAKEWVTGEVVPPNQEQSTYSLAVVDYIAKVAAIELVAPGIDFWMNEPVSETATGTDESHTFVDRAESLRKLGEQLLAETRRKADEILALLPEIPLRLVKSVPTINTLDDEFLTPSHQEFARPYIRTGRS